MIEANPDRPAIVLENVVKRFGDRLAIDHLTLSVRSGEVLGLLGPNGSGKTTTVNLITGLARATSGSVVVLGHDVAVHPERVRASFGAVPQETALYEELTAAHNLRLHADLHRVPRALRDQRVEEMLALVGLTERARDLVRTFSGGMKRRLALARALIHHPNLILLDEPTLGVDVQSRRALWDHILALRASGRTILLTTNYLEEADALCDRIAIVDHGRLVALDTPAGLRAHVGSTLLTIVVAADPAPAMLAVVRATAGVLDVQAVGRTLTVSLAGGDVSSGDVVTAVTRTCGIASLRQSEPTMDAVFLGLTGRELRD